MITDAVLTAIEEAGGAVLALTEGLDEGELLASRLIRSEVSRQLGALARELRAVPEPAMRALPGVDWAGWRALGSALTMEGSSQDEALWFGVRTLVPATLQSLRDARRGHPGRFLHAA